MQTIANLRITNMTSTVTATRGERLVLVRCRVTFRDQGPDAFVGELLGVAEINAHERVIAAVLFDLDDFEAAIEELDTRYLAGEAAAHADTWSVIARTYAAFNRHEFPSTTQNSVYIDHRPLVTNDATDLTANIRAIWDLMDVSIYIAESVHRLSELGAVVTQTLKGTSKEGLDIESRMIDIFTVEGDLLSRCEVFDEADLDAALARFEELHPPMRRLENAASQVEQRFLTYFAARDWDAYAEMLSDDVCMDDRRHVVNAGVRHGRDAEIASQRAVADVGVTHFTSTVIAIRGRRLALACYSVFDGWSGSKVLCVSEINAENQIVARVAFDLTDIDAAFEELDARYLAGEAAAHSHAWAVIARLYAGFNDRHQLPATTPDLTFIDHRPLISVEASDLPASIRAIWDLTPEIGIYMEAAHRLSDVGVVVTHTARGISREDFDAEWRLIAIFTVEGDLISRCEMFDEADVDAALARFDELDRPTLLENAATRTWARQADAFNRRDVNSFFTRMTADGRFEDRRKGLRVVTEGPARRKAVQAVFDEAPSSWRMRAEPIAIRGSRLELTRECYLDTDEADRPIVVEFLHVMEVSASGLVQDIVSFDSDDIDAAFEELDARYLTGEAAAHAHTWSVIASSCAAFNRRELPAADWVTIDHRPLAPIDASDLQAAIRAIWDLTPDLSTRIEAVHRLSSFGAVATYAARGTSPEGFAAEWRMIDVLTVEGDRFSRCEMFDETDLDAALARFDELDQPTES